MSSSVSAGSLENVTAASATAPVTGGAATWIGGAVLMAVLAISNFVLLRRMGGGRTGGLPR